MEEYGSYKYLDFIPVVEKEDIDYLLKYNDYIEGIYLDYALEWDENNKPVAGWVSTSRDLKGWHCHGHGSTITESILNMMNQIRKHEHYDR